MPYRTDAELPPGVKDNLPAHAQDIYREAFNSAWQEYQDASKRRGTNRWRRWPIRSPGRR
jgi:cation transport regulator